MSNWFIFLKKEFCERRCVDLTLTTTTQRVIFHRAFREKVDDKNCLNRLKKKGIKQIPKLTKSSHCTSSGQYPPAASPVYAVVFHSFIVTRCHISTICPSNTCNTIPRPNYLSITLLPVKSLPFTPLTHCPVWLYYPRNRFPIMFLLIFLVLAITQSWKKKNKICYIILL